MGEREGKRMGEREGKRMGEREGKRMGEKEGKRMGEREGKRKRAQRESVLFIGTQFSILYTSLYSPAKAATPRA